MKWLRLHDFVYLVLAIVLAAVGFLSSQKLKDPDVGWLFGIFAVTLVVVQFMYVYELRNNISFFVSDYQKIRDKFLREVVDQKLSEIQQLAQNAGKEGRIDLNLDDLFIFVTLLVQRCEKLEAVDIRTERWLSDTRARTYFRANREATKRGASISRIFVFGSSARRELADFISDGSESERIKEIRKLLKDQKDAGIKIAFIFDDEPEKGEVYDFGVFDDKRVLDENFDALGNSKYGGFISSVSHEVRRYKERYETLWNLAQKHNGALNELVKD